MSLLSAWQGCGQKGAGKKVLTDSSWPLQEAVRTLKRNALESSQEKVSHLVRRKVDLRWIQACRGSQAASFAVRLRDGVQDGVWVMYGTNLQG